ncbi:MAG: hypothetical protein M3Q49_06220 [Actinomycetota bacterium]|nr:hypothetical protein [Actinomycetota bacterium]
MRFWDGEKWVEGKVLGEIPVPSLDADELLDGMEWADAMERAAKEQAKRRGMLTGDIHQTDAWFRDDMGRS